MSDEPIVTFFSQETPDGGVIRLMKVPEGYQLWYHGQMAWRSYGKPVGVAKELHDALFDVQQQCLFADDYGGIGVSEDVVIPSEMFDTICKVLAKARGEG